VEYIDNGVLFHKEWNNVICMKMNGTGDDHIRQNKDRKTNLYFSLKYWSV
jgi:hypothetical protein